MTCPSTPACVGASNTGLRWAQVDLKRKRVSLIETKSGHRQHVVLNTSAQQALKQLRASYPKSEFVCPAQDEWPPGRWWDAVRKESKVSDFHWHDLRHTFTSRLVMNGVDIYTVNKLMRHETLQVTKRYAHLSDAHLRQAAERLAGVTPSVTAIEKPATRVYATIQ